MPVMASGTTPNDETQTSSGTLPMPRLAEQNLKTLVSYTRRVTLVIAASGSRCVGWVGRGPIASS